MAVEALDAYLDFLDSSNTTTDKEAQPTPCIDNILRNYQQRNLAGHKINEPAVAVENGGYEGRLFLLEKQLTDLLQRSKTSSPCKLTRRGSDSENSESHENSPPPSTSRFPVSDIRRRQLHTSSGQSTQSRHTPSKRPLLSARERVQRSQRTVKMKDGGRHLVVSSPREDHKTKKRLLTESRKQQESSAKGENTLKVLSEDLDRERERRWKAEQAAGRLVEHVRKLQSRLSESQCQREQCVVREAQLQKEVREKTENLGTLQKQLEDVQTTAKSRQTEIQDLKTIESKHLEMLHKLEETCRVLESEQLRERAELCARLHESERSSAGHEREVETMKKSVKELKRQIHDLQELLANREKEHMRELEKYRPLPGNELSELVRKEVERERSKMEMTLEQQKKLLLEKEKAYHDLEDEFRLALRIEASRYQELQTSHQEVVGEIQSSRETAMAAVKKEQRATALVAELTAMIKEQKARIGELHRSKQEAAASLKERAEEMEEMVKCRNKLEVKVQVLQEENSRLSAQVAAQESVISGLREERQLWSKELAHQGATLAQDRGRLEMEVDSLSKECKSLREELGRERDAVRIKEKQVEDQLQTIHHIKRELSGKDHEFESRKLEWEREQQSLQLLLEQEEASSQQLQEEVASLVERKGQLKEEKGRAQEEVDQWKDKYRKLKSQWDEKMEVLNRLEQNVADVQGSFKEKEATLVKERDEALEKARSCEQRLKSCDDAFRHQLEAKQKAHDSHVTKVVAEKDRETAQAYQRVSAVEEEMRDLLKEVAAEKKAMEAKLQRLSQAFQELHIQDT